MSADVVQEDAAEPTRPTQSTAEAEPQQEQEPRSPTPILLKRLSEEKVYKCVNTVLRAASTKRRRFVETVDLLVCLKDYNIQKYKRVSGVLKLPHYLKPGFRGCLIGFKAERKEARAANLDFIGVHEVKLMHSRPMAMKRLAARYDGFLAREQHIQVLNKVLRQSFSKKRKYITPVLLGQPLHDAVEEIRRSTMLWMKSDPAFGISVGHVKMDVYELADNVMAVVTQVLEKLRHGWDNVRSLNIKSSMGPVYQLY
ncbi:hypothetical protein HPB51_028746 [Rhipicephalus microplus]|uniref:Large ribosomal subunit protein uL1 n=1 Tax=Rhipicephalus microplus TaxID=6941 RepID=A0A9J6CW32_RHIMP|nr:hypothetical protein HPB51_028746 [Rhipicephalus microplus]